MPLVHITFTDSGKLDHQRVVDFLNYPNRRYLIEISTEEPSDVIKNDDSMFVIKGDIPFVRMFIKKHDINSNFDVRDSISGLGLGQGWAVISFVE